ncbi:VCBS repeat-containing protein [Streptomyces cinnamoneus]|uniref:FG-GAP repeat domain-containing protein n=1 Tax=Streptomyces cinnamoneus TaxID=53446 RepID=UPI0033DF2961
MAPFPGRTRGRALSRLVTAAIAAALVGTAAGTAAADGPAPAAADVSVAPPTPPAAAASSSRAASPVFPLMAVGGTSLYQYWPDGQGGFADRKTVVSEKWRGITATVQVDHNQNGLTDGHYVRTADGTLRFTHPGPTPDAPVVHDRIGGGWNIYDLIASPGNLGGAGQADLVARDTSGVLWIYMAHADGTLSDRYRVGPGWDVYTDIAGRGDLNGDGKTDIVAKDKNGVLWFYKGTGNAYDPFESRVKVGGGWDAYNLLVSSGDVNLDGRSDLLARDKSGVLWLYRGNGNATDPFDNRVRIGGGWGQYSTMF